MHVSLKVNQTIYLLLAGKNKLIIGGEKATRSGEPEQRQTFHVVSLLPILHTYYKQRTYALTLLLLRFPDRTGSMRCNCSYVFDFVCLSTNTVITNTTTTKIALPYLGFIAIMPLYKLIASCGNNPRTITYIDRGLCFVRYLFFVCFCFENYIFQVCSS